MFSFKYGYVTTTYHHKNPNKLREMGLVHLIALLTILSKICHNEMIKTLLNYSCRFYTEEKQKRDLKLTIYDSITKDSKTVSKLMK